MPSRKRMVATFFAAITIISSSNIAAKADGLMARLQAVAHACDSDVKSLCEGSAGGVAVIRCLGANYMNVSQGCRNIMASAMNAVCGQDLARLCPGTPLGSGLAESCLQNHLADLKGSCKAAADRFAAK